MAIPADDPLWSRQVTQAAERWAMNEQMAGEAKGTAAAEALLPKLESVPAGPQRDALLAGLAHYGSSNDIPFAVRVVAEMGEGRPRDQAMTSLAELWMREDPVALSEWLTGLPPHASRHAAVRRFADLLEKTDAERAAQWRATLPQDQQSR